MSRVALMFSGVVGSEFCELIDTLTINTDRALLLLTMLLFCACFLWIIYKKDARHALKRPSCMYACLCSSPLGHGRNQLASALAKSSSRHLSLFSCPAHACSLPDVGEQVFVDRPEPAARGGWLRGRCASRWTCAAGPSAKLLIRRDLGLHIEAAA